MEAEFTMNVWMEESLQFNRIWEIDHPQKIGVARENNFLNSLVMRCLSTLDKS